MNTTLKYTLLATGITTLVGCQRASEQAADERREGTKADTAASEAPIAVRAAARNAAGSIAESRCRHEDTCKNVGDSKKYSSAQDCLDRVQSEWRDDLSARKCPNGINDTQLEQCLTKIRGEECNRPLDSLARISECTAAQICRT